MIKVCMIGLGKTGLSIAKKLLNSEGIKLVMAVSSPNSSKIGKDIGELLNARDTGVVVTGADKLSDNIKVFRPDVVVDFSSPEACTNNIEIVSKHKINMVIATTGFNELQEQKVKALTIQNKIGVVIAPNITLGVNVMKFVCELTAGLLSDYDAEITESHHKYKKDSPSGTALKIAESIFRGRNSDVNSLIFDRSEVQERQEGEIGISAVRAGGIVGIHKAYFASEHDMLEISHQSFDRDVFAAGAIKAIHFIAGKKGLYDMDDVLDLKSALQNYLTRDSVVV